MGLNSRTARDPHADAPVKARAPAPLPPNVALITALQRSAGNAAVARLLARVPAATIPPPAPETAAEPPGGGGLELTPKQQTDLLMETHSHVNQAMLAWSNACLLEREEISARAKADADIAALVIDVACGYAAPFVGRFVGSLMIAKLFPKLPATATAQLTALAGNADFVKATFASSGRIANLAIRATAPQLFADPDENAYLATLSDASHAGTQAVTDSLDNLTVEGVLALWYAYSYEFTNVTVYREAIKQLLDEYGRFVVDQGNNSVPIEEMPGVEVGRFKDDTRVYEADLFGGTRLILVTATSEEDAGGEPVGGGDLIFKGYVPERLYSHARSETVRLYGAVTQIDPATIGPIPAPDDAPPPPPEFAP